MTEAKNNDELELTKAFLELFSKLPKEEKQEIILQLKSTLIYPLTTG